MIDPVELLELAEAQCTDEEIAAKLGVPLEALQALNDKIAVGRDKGKAKLRKALFDRAVGGIDFYGKPIEATREVAVWLSKQYLKMADKVQEDRTLTINVRRANWDAEGEIVQGKEVKAIGEGDSPTTQVHHPALPKARSKGTRKRNK